MSEENMPPALKAMIEAIEEAGGKVKSIRPAAKDETEEPADEPPLTLISRSMIQREIERLDEASDDAMSDCDKDFGKDQDLYDRRSTLSVMGLILQEPKALGSIMDSYKVEAEKEGVPVDMPTPQELMRFQICMGLGIPTFTGEVALFAGAILGRSGLSHQDVLRLMNEPSFMNKVLMLKYRAEDLGNVARDTLEKLDAALAENN